MPILDKIPTSRYIATLSVLVAINVSALTPRDVVRSLCDRTDVAGTARFTVAMQQLPEDVVYGIKFVQQAAVDRLAPCSYLIEWENDRSGNVTSGFTAYFAGHHYRFAGERRLQEYHMDWDSIPFMPSQASQGLDRGVQRTARFVDVLPAFVGENIARELDSPGFVVTINADTIVDGCRRSVIRSRFLVDGSVTREVEYVFDSSTLLPVRITKDNNLGSISEQTVTISYDFASPVLTGLPPLSEQLLIDRYPEVFASMRQSNFRIENLRGLQLPAFSLPTSTGERYSRMVSDGFRTPTLVVLMESADGFNGPLVKAVREAVDVLSYEADVIWAFADSHVDSAEKVVGQLRSGEHLLISARGLVRDCGAAMLPSILMVDAAGIVRDVTIGFNKDAATDVIQKMTLIDN